MILLEKSLLVLDEGVLEGRKVFVNIVKYVQRIFLLIPPMRCMSCSPPIA